MDCEEKEDHTQDFFLLKLTNEFACEVLRSLSHKFSELSEILPNMPVIISKLATNN